MRLLEPCFFVAAENYVPDFACLVAQDDHKSPVIFGELSGNRLASLQTAGFGELAADSFSSLFDCALWYILLRVDEDIVVIAVQLRLFRLCLAPEQEALRRSELKHMEVYEQTGFFCRDLKQSRPLCEGLELVFPCLDSLERSVTRVTLSEDAHDLKLFLLNGKAKGVSAFAMHLMTVIQWSLFFYKLFFVIDRRLN